MTGFPDAPLIGPGSELQLTIDGGAVLHREVVAEAVLASAAAVVAAAELVDGLEVGEGGRGARARPGPRARGRARRVTRTGRPRFVVSKPANWRSMVPCETHPQGARPRRTRPPAPLGEQSALGGRERREAHSADRPRAPGSWHLPQRCRERPGAHPRRRLRHGRGRGKAGRVDSRCPGRPAPGSARLEARLGDRDLFRVGPAAAAGLDRRCGPELGQREGLLVAELDREGELLAGEDHAGCG